MRFFFDQDEEGHWYLVPESSREDWEDFVEDEDRQDEGDVPDGATAIDGVNRFVFENPRELT